MKLIYIPKCGCLLENLRGLGMECHLTDASAADELNIYMAQNLCWFVRTARNWGFARGYFREFDL